jgi:hypothetical protein
MRHIRPVKDQLNSLEQIYGQFVVTCPAENMGHFKFSRCFRILRTQKSGIISVLEKVVEDVERLEVVSEHDEESRSDA